MFYQNSFFDEGDDNFHFWVTHFNKCKKDLLSLDSMNTHYRTLAAARQTLKKFHMLKSTAAKPVKVFQLLLNQEQNDPLTAYEKQKKSASKVV